MAFLVPYLLFLAVTGILVCLYDKATIHLYINEHSHGKADLFFRLITYLGDGITVAIIALALLLYKFRAALLVGISGILSGIFVQSLKHTVFDGMNRPVKFFEHIHALYLIPGVQNYSDHTFPSGHSASAFALYFSLSLFTENKLLKFLLFSLALTVGFSRVYLSQHFINDVMAGSFFGMLAVILAYVLLARVKPFVNAGWMDKSLFNSRKEAL